MEHVWPNIASRKRIHLTSKKFLRNTIWHGNVKRSSILSPGNNHKLRRKLEIIISWLWKTIKRKLQMRSIYSWKAPKLQVGGIGLHCSCLEILPSNLLWSQLGWCDSFTRKRRGVKSIASLTKESDLIRKSRKYTQYQMGKSCSDPNQRPLCWLVQAAK